MLSEAANAMGPRERPNDPVADDAVGVLDALEAVAVNALLLERSDDALDHTVLLRAVRGDELLPQPIAAHQRREVAACEE